MTITLERPTAAHYIPAPIPHMRRVATLYADLRAWHTRVQHYPSPIMPTPRGGDRAPSGAQPQRQQVVEVYLLERWVDTEKYFKLERRLEKPFKYALEKVRQAPKGSAQSLPSNFGSLFDNVKISHQMFADIFEGLEMVLILLDGKSLKDYTPNM